MGASADDLFGGAARGEPATPGSFGEAPAAFRLPDSTRVGPVRLEIADLARSLDYYTGVLGLRAIDRGATEVTLGAHGDARPLVTLAQRAGARPAPRRGRLGLYHFAILLPDRASLGRFVTHLADVGARAGAADHLVSEAFYLQDPDNLGIEVYADRPREAWRRQGRATDDGHGPHRRGRARAGGRRHAVGWHAVRHGDGPRAPARRRDRRRTRVLLGRARLRPHRVELSRRALPRARAATIITSAPTRGPAPTRGRPARATRDSPNGRSSCPAPRPWRRPPRAWHAAGSPPSAGEAT